MTWLIVFLVVAAAALLAWGWFEAGWLRRRVLDVHLDRVSPALDGLRVAHLSDLHLGMPSRGLRASEEAVAWVEERRPDLVCITGDLLSRPAGAALLRSLVDRLSAVAPCFVVLGNHDHGLSRDPLSRAIEDVDLGEARVLADEAVAVDLRGERVRVVGVDPRSYENRAARPEQLTETGDDLRLLLCHYPGIAGRLPDGAFDLVLAGHLHAGQIAMPFPGGRIRLSHPSTRETEGLYHHRGGVLHISPGLGTTFVPFRFFARPEATELVVRSVA